MRESAGRERPVNQDLVMTHVVDAPVDVVYKAWTEAERLARWWGPKGLRMRVCKLDLRPGGMFHYAVRNRDGRDVWARLAYKEVVPRERLVFVNAYSDDEGNPVRHPTRSTWPLEVMNTLAFAENRGKTTLTLRTRPLYPTRPEQEAFDAGRASVFQGFAGTWQQLDAYLAQPDAPAA